MATAAGFETAADPAPVLVDTGALRMQELRRPYQLQRSMKLEEIDDVTGDRTLQPTTVDQGIRMFHLWLLLHVGFIARHTCLC